MEKKNIDWASLGFGYVQTDYRYVSNYRDGAWDEGELITDDQVHMSESANVLQSISSTFVSLRASLQVITKQTTRLVSILQLDIVSDITIAL